MCATGLRARICPSQFRTAQRRATVITINTSAPTAGAALNGTSATSLVTRLRTRSRVALAGVGCFVAVAAGSAVLSTPAMAASTQCKLTTTTFNTVPISATLSGYLCYNGSNAWDPNPAATKLTYSVPWYLSWAYSVTSASKGNYNYESGNRGTEEIWGNVIVQDLQPFNGLGSKFEIYLRLDCTPTGGCTAREWPSPLG
jgi:hypothetical protein